jgi:histidinol-phosphate/aromatic aminotransferase/cobyric acid decarboxylase-like protein
MKVLMLIHTDLPGMENTLRISVGTKEQNDTLLSALKEITATEVL